jgi:hypothetical protein
MRGKRLAPNAFFEHKTGEEEVGNPSFVNIGLLLILVDLSDCAGNFKLHYLERSMNLSLQTSAIKPRNQKLDTTARCIKGLLYMEMKGQGTMIRERGAKGRGQLVVGHVGVFFREDASGNVCL